MTKNLKDKTFYTNFHIWGNDILYRGIENGSRITCKRHYKPTLFVQSTKSTKYKTIYGQPVDSVKFDSIRDAKDFIGRYKEVDNFEIYGNDAFKYCYIVDTYPNEIDYDFDKLRIAYLDIEVGSDNGFPIPDLANEPVTAISLKIKNHFYVIGCGDFTSPDKHIIYKKCSNEGELLYHFLEVWSRDYPDIVSGWAISSFDIPYLVNRITKVLGEKQAKRLSPWGIFNERSVTLMGRTQSMFAIAGVSILDYIELYKKFAPTKNRESYKLDYISEVELGERKVDYSEYGNLRTLYKENHQKFIEYNIFDTELVAKLENKMKIIEMAVALCYDAKVNFDDVFGQVRMWDTLIYNRLKKDNIVVPPKREGNKDFSYQGAYVKEPQPGLHEWLVCFDVSSLYPNLISMLNLSPETIRPEKFKPVEIDGLLTKKYDLSDLKESNMSMAANGHCFSKDRHGFLAQMMKEKFDERQEYKKKQIDSTKELEEAKQQFKTHKTLELKEKIKQLGYDVSRYKVIQEAKKVQINSAYGVCGNQYFRYYDVRLAEGITLSGQFVINYIKQHINKFLNKWLKTAAEKDFIIAMDTDSLYITLADVIRAIKNPPDKDKLVSIIDKICIDVITPQINKACEEIYDYLNVHMKSLSMKRESISDKGVWTSKKHYFLQVLDNEGVRYNEPKIKIVGLESVRSSTPKICRERIKDCLGIVLNQTEKDIQVFIENFKKEFKTCSWKDIACPRTVNGLDKYKDSSKLYSKGSPVQVKATLIYNHLIKEKKLTGKYDIIQEGEKMRFIYLKSPNTIREEVIGFIDYLPDEFSLEKFIDYDKQFKVCFLKPVQSMLTIIGWNAELIRDLSEFFV